MSEKVAFTKRFVSIVLTLICISTFSACDKPESSDTTTSGKNSTTSNTSNSTSDITSTTTESTDSPVIDTSESISANSVEKESSLIGKTQATTSDNNVTFHDYSATQLKIKNATVVQDKFIGFGGLYMAYNYIPDNQERYYTEEMRQLEMDRLEEMGVTVVRTTYFPAWAWDSTTETWDWDSVSMTGFYTFLGEMKKRGIDVAVTMGNTTKVGTSYTTAGGDVNPFAILSNNDQDKAVDYYAQWIVDSVRQILDRGYTNMKYLMAFTEPGMVPTGTAEEKLETWKQCIMAAHNALKKAGLRDSVKIVGPDTTIMLSLFEYVVNDEDLQDAIDIYSHHYYYNTSESMYTDTYYSWCDDFEEALEVTEGTDKEYWCDEWGFYLSGYTDADIHLEHPWMGTQNAVAMVAGMNCGVQTMMRWSLADQLWPNETQNNSNGEWVNGVQRWGLTPNLLTSSIPRPVYYAYSLISKYTSGNNTKVYKGVGKNQVYLTACQLEDGNWTVIVVSENLGEQKFDITFENSINTTLYRHAYNPSTIEATPLAHMIDPDKTITNVGNSLTDTIMPGCVYVYTSIKE